MQTPVFKDRRFRMKSTDSKRLAASINVTHIENYIYECSVTFNLNLDLDML